MKTSAKMKMVTIPVERLDVPNRNGRIYTHKCIEEAIINNEAVQKEVNQGTCFIFSKPQDIGCKSINDICGRVLGFHIKNNILYADTEIDLIDINNAYLVGTGYLNEDSCVKDYEFDHLFTTEDCLS